MTNSLLYSFFVSNSLGKRYQNKWVENYCFILAHTTSIIFWQVFCLYCHDVALEAGYKNKLILIGQHLPQWLLPLENSLLSIYISYSHAVTCGQKDCK
ncbi:hypothetical protein Nmel_006826 [Mimus melanotis]